MLFKYIFVLQFSLFIVSGRCKTPTYSNGQQGISQSTAPSSDGKTMYSFTNIKLSYQEAENFCKTQSSYLFQIDAEDRMEIKKLLYVDLTLPDDNPNSYIWISSKSSSDQISSLFPNGASQTSKCYRIQKTLISIDFSMGNCAEQGYFYCESQVGAIPPRTPPTLPVFSDPPSVINNLANSIITNYPKDAPTSKRQMKDLLNTMNKILDEPASGFIENDQKSLSETIFRVENALNNYNFDKGNLTLNLANIKMEAIKVTIEPGIKKSLSLGDDRKPNTKSSNALIDENLLQELFDNGNEKLRLTSVVYRRPDIFKGAEDVSNDVDKQPYPSHILTNVLSVSVGGMHVSHLSSPLQIISSIPQYTTNKSFSEVDQRFSKVPSLVRQNPGKYIDGDMRYTVEEKCAFWDFSKSSWSTEGCRMESKVHDGDSKEIKCSCDHMTHFAVILDLEGAYFPKYISTITTIGCWTSIVCLFFKILGSCYFKKLRKTPPQKILNRICSSLFLTNLFFVVGIDKTEDANACFAFTILLHYSVLLLWSWFLVQGLFFFRYLIWAKYRPGNIEVETSFKIATALSYVVPAIVVASSAAALERNAYQSERYCWLERDPLLYSIVIPIGIIIFINTVIFAVAFYNITWGRKMFAKETSLKELSLGLRRAVSMMFTLGIPWTLGYMLLLSSNKKTKEAFSVIFSILNSFQGVLIFILLFVRQKDVQKLFRSKYNKVMRRPSTTSTSQSSQQKTRLMSVDSGKTISSMRSLRSTQSDATTKI